MYWKVSELIGKVPTKNGEVVKFTVFNTTKLKYLKLVSKLFISNLIALSVL